MMAVKARSLSALWAPAALLPEGWAKDVRLVIDEQGGIAAILKAAAPEPGDRRAPGPVIPGLANLHSHAFQRAMAGLGEIARDPEDSFWSWRDLMYRLVERLDPDLCQAIAAHLYIEMLKGGYTGVAEFHYLHHDRGGRPFQNPAEMAMRHLAAAESAGIAITLLPVFYAHGGFGGQAPRPAQARFLHGIEDFLALGEALYPHCRKDDRRLGLAFHSLRAATEAEMRVILESWIEPRHKESRLERAAPIHIHIAEQRREIEDCLAWSGARPIAWLLDRFPIDSRWTLIHATHADDGETARLAESGAIAGLCPTTEANLGDGFFPAAAFTAAGGRFGIGSDSHVGLDVAEELRWLEYGERLRAERRNRLHGGLHGKKGGEEGSVAHFLYENAAAAGAVALGRAGGRIAIGAKADFVVLDGENPLLAGIGARDPLGRFIFAGSRSLVRDVIVGGRLVIEDGHHAEEAKAAAAFAAALRALE